MLWHTANKDEYDRVLAGINKYTMATCIDDMQVYACFKADRSLDFDDDTHSFTTFIQRLTAFVNNACTFLNTIARFMTPLGGFRADAAGDPHPHAPTRAHTHHHHRHRRRYHTHCLALLCSRVAHARCCRTATTAHTHTRGRHGTALTRRGRGGCGRVVHSTLGTFRPDYGNAPVADDCLIGRVPHVASACLLSVHIGNRRVRVRVCQLPS